MAQPICRMQEQEAGAGKTEAYLEFQLRMAAAAAVVVGSAAAVAAARDATVWAAAVAHRS